MRMKGYHAGAQAFLFRAFPDRAQYLLMAQVYAVEVPDRCGSRVLYGFFGVKDHFHFIKTGIAEGFMRVRIRPLQMGTF